MQSLVLTALFSMFYTFNAVAQADTSACPCCAPEHRLFDFWIGEWNVYRPDGKLAGTNMITVQQDSCILREEWTSAAGAYTGTSYNYFDNDDSLWHQLWIDNQGGVLKLSGNKSGNQMILASTEMAGQAPSTQHRITWTANTDGTVRQHWQSKTGNEEWKTLFDGLYQKKD